MVILYFVTGTGNFLQHGREQKVTIATKFIVGDKDIGFESNGTREHIPNLEVVILDGRHFIQQERAQEVSDEILSFASFQDIE